MDGQDITVILDRMAEIYTGGAYPGRNSEGLNPEWPCDPFHVLIATILSQRTKDDNTRKASDNLFRTYPTMETLAEADPAAVAALIRPAGFPNQKAKAIVGCCRIILDRYGGKVPEDTEQLCSLPMVGRKTAACVRSYAMCIPSVCVDTHVHRISNLMGLVHTSDPESTEFALMEITPEDRWSDINRYFVRHGQECCLPNRPRCSECMVKDMCQHGMSHRFPEPIHGRSPTDCRNVVFSCRQTADIHAVRLYLNTRHRNKSLQAGAESADLYHSL